MNVHNICKSKCNVIYHRIIVSVKHRNIYPESIYSASHTAIISVFFCFVQNENNFCLK